MTMVDSFCNTLNMVTYQLKQVRKLFDSHPTYLTVYRWTKYGLIGPRGFRVRLESYLDGGRRYVSSEAVEDFKRKLNE